MPHLQKEELDDKGWWLILNFDGLLVNAFLFDQFHDRLEEIDIHMKIFRPGELILIKFQ